MAMRGIMVIMVIMVIITRARHKKAHIVRRRLKHQQEPLKTKIQRRLEEQRMK